MPRRSPSLAAVAVLAAVLLPACGDGGGGTDTPIPSAMQKTGGDGQSGAPGTSVPQPLEVKVTDDRGRGVPDFTVSFSTTGGSVSPQSMDTDADGRARTTLTLPNAEGTVTVTASGAGIPSVQFTAESVPEQLSFATAALPAGRVSIAYGQTIEAVGGTGAGYTFTLTSGTPPPGLVLESDGSFSGTPTGTGDFPITVQVSDSDGETASRGFQISTCPAPAPMAVGEARVFSTSTVGACGVWLPNDGADQYYRIGLIRTNRSSEGGARDVVATVSGNGVTAAAAAATGGFRTPSISWEALALPRDLLGEMAAHRTATRRRHADMARQADDLLRRFGPPATPIQEGPARIARADLPAKLRIDVAHQCLSDGSTPSDLVTAIKIGEDDRLAIYQDSIQNASATTRVTSQQATILLEYYREHGAEVIDSYFGGVDDIDGNGKIIIFVTPEASGSTLGFVWPGDFFAKSQCSTSNEGELVYLNVDEILALTDPEEGNIGFSLYALVHEIQHVAGVYERLEGGHGQQPLWLGEGLADVAAVSAARDRWAETGGPAYTATLVESHVREELGRGLTSEILAVILEMFRVQSALAEQPNSLLKNTGHGDDVYGTGWLLLQWMADAYGGGATARFADAGFFSDLTDRATPSDVEGIEDVTGAGWETLLEEFVAALMYNGTGVAGPKPIARYDFVSAWEDVFCAAVDPFQFSASTCSDNEGAQPGPPGDFPWPVTVNSSGSQQYKFLTSASFQGQAEPGGFRVHDFRTNGTGLGAEINISVQAPARVVVIRTEDPRR